jgi:putative ABC transport system ATP-binding protein
MSPGGEPGINRDRARDFILRVEALSRVVDGVPLVDGVSVSVRRGEVLAVTGPSGSGKTSFLRLLNRLDEPTGGRVFLEGQDYRLVPPQELRRRVGMLMQSPFLFPGTVGENIRFGPQQRADEIGDREIIQLLARVGLAGYLERNVARLSGGEAQRVSLARTLANFPQVLLLDEPTSALDEGTKSEVERLIFSIVREGNLTCLIVTHDEDQSVRVSDRVMVLERGRLVRLGAAEEVIDA